MGRLIRAVDEEGVLAGLERTQGSKLGLSAAAVVLEELLGTLLRELASDAHSHDGGFVYDGDRQWRLTRLGSSLEARFDLASVPSPAALTLRHLSSASADCPGGGYSPVDILVNGQVLEPCYDVAERHGGSHGYVTNRWDIQALLHPGTNSVQIILCEQACTQYWIQDLFVPSLGEGCASCTLNRGAELGAPPF